MTEKTTAAETPVKTTGGKRRLRGVVVADRSDKTIRVRVERRVRHGLYGKFMRLHSNVQAHDEENACRVGDTVVVEETPRVSKTKGWRLVERLPRGQQ